MRDTLISRVALHGGMSAEEACPAIVAVLGALRGQLGAPEAEALADELPDDFAAVLRRGSYAGGRDLAAEVAELEQLQAARAIEHAASVFRALAELLPNEVLTRLRQALPQHTATLLASPMPETLEAHPHASRGTLAEGRPGSRHPLSESSPRAAQAESVVTRDNPHGDTKLSSSHGLTQEREGESLAIGRPGSQHTLANTRRDR